MSDEPTLFEKAGGEEALRRVIDDFVERVFDDLMIGFIFRRARKPRIREFEYQHAASHLGGPVEYRGQDLRAAHAKHRIFGGHFARRRQILKEVLEAHGLPAEVRTHWLAHQDALRAEITGDLGAECIGKTAAKTAPEDGP